MRLSSTTASTLLPLASAANIDARQATDLKYEISDFSAAYTPEASTVCLSRYPHPPHEHKHKAMTT